jgi:hypothetical protein
MEQVVIKYTRFENRFGRKIGLGQLCYANGDMIANGSFAQLMEIVKENDFELTNSQELLDLLISLGFAS